MHQRQPLAGSRGKGPCAGRRSSAAHAHGRVLGLHRNKLRIQLAVCDDFSKMLYHVGLRCDGIGRYGIHIAGGGDFSNGDGDFYTFSYSH